MKPLHLVAALAALSLLPVSVFAALDLSQGQGTLSGKGVTPTHDFPVNATQFRVAISDADATGHRLVTVRVPIEGIDTENGARNGHMLRTVFNGFKEAGQLDVVYEARTDAPLAPGNLTLDGTLTILGKAVPQQVELVLSGTDPLLAKGTADVDLARWGIKTPGFGPMHVQEVVTMGFELQVPADGSVAAAD